MAQKKQNRQFISKRTLENLINPFARQRTRALVHPFRAPEPTAAPPEPFHIQVFDFTNGTLEEKEITQVEECFHYKSKDSITWLNLEGIHKPEVELIARHFDIHPLIQEDILSYGERPKMDEVNNIIFVLLNMLFYNQDKKGIEHEQISIILGKNYVISFQEDARRDVFNPIREKLRNASSKIRQSPADYLFYAMIDIIVDSYFSVIEKVGEAIEAAEEELIVSTGRQAFHNINLIRKELILLKRNTTPVRDLVSAILRNDSELLHDNTTKYYKDVYDHIMQANDLVDNYRDLVVTLQDMYFNNVNLRMNEVMKTLAIVTTVMAPATVIGGIFGMNFDVIPYAHHNWGFYGTVAFMLLIPIVMILWFRHRGWFQQTNPTQDDANA